MTTAPTKPAPVYTSGFCQTAMHLRCPGGHRDTRCSCTCHRMPPGLLHAVLAGRGYGVPDGRVTALASTLQAAAGLGPNEAALAVTIALDNGWRPT